MTAYNRLPIEDFLSFDISVDIPRYSRCGTWLYYTQDRIGKFAGGPRGE